MQGETRSLIRIWFYEHSPSKWGTATMFTFCNTVFLVHVNIQLWLYPRHLFRQVNSFRLFVHPFVCSFVCTSITFGKFTSKFALKFLKWCILSQQKQIRKHSYSDQLPWRVGIHSWPRTQGSMPLGGARGQDLGHLKKWFFIYNWSLGTMQCWLWLLYDLGHGGSRPGWG